MAQAVKQIVRSVIEQPHEQVHPSNMHVYEAPSRPRSHPARKRKPRQKRLPGAVLIALIVIGNFLILGACLFLMTYWQMIFTLVHGLISH